MLAEGEVAGEKVRGGGEGEGRFGDGDRLAGRLGETDRRRRGRQWRR